MINNRYVFSQLIDYLLNNEFRSESGHFIGYCRNP
jgi:hypothetical protein